MESEGWLLKIILGTIDIKTRPLRMAYLIEPSKPDQLREAIQLASSLWGGDFSPIVPLYKKIPNTWRERPFKTPSAETAIRGYIEAFDPDLIVQFSQDLPQYIRDIGVKIIKPSDIWDSLVQDDLRPKYGIGVFELFDELYDNYFKYKRKYPIEVVLPLIPSEYPLFWASYLGEISGDVLKAIEKYYTEPVEIKKSEISLQDFSKYVSGNLWFPRKITRYGTTKRSSAGFRGNVCAYYLDATKVEDVIDFWNLRAMGKLVFPVPKQLQGSPHIKEALADFLKRHRRPSAHNPHIYQYASIIHSKNTTVEELKGFVNTLSIPHKLEDALKSPYYVFDHYPKVWDEWSRDNNYARPADAYADDENTIDLNDSNQLSVRYKPVLPSFADQSRFYGETKCANEISFRFYGSSELIAETFPKSTGNKFISAISRLGSFGEWRVGRNGLVKLVKSNFNETWDMPSAEKVFFAWLSDKGWNAKLSSTGILSAQIYSKLKGHLAILRNEGLLKLFEYMNGGNSRATDSSDKKNCLPHERYLCCGDLVTRLKSITKPGNWYEYLADIGIFRPGLKIQCPHCTRHIWFPIENINASFPCPLCLNTFPAVRNIDESKWAYKTTGPFSVPNHAEGSYSVLLTLDFISGKKMHDMRVTPTFSFNFEAPGKVSGEIDFAAFWQEAIYGQQKSGVLFAECKSYNKFTPADFNRMRYLAKAFPGAVLVFSTLRKSLTKSEIVQMARIAKAGRKYWKGDSPINPVLILTGHELLTYESPPDCWGKEAEKKFSYISGIMDLCDITQQRYLGLRSREHEYREKWEKKMNRKRVTLGDVLAPPAPQDKD